MSPRSPYVDEEPASEGAPDPDEGAFRPGQGSTRRAGWTRRRRRSIFRTEHTTEFVIIANKVLQDQRLSFRARGVLAYLLSRPDDWDIAVERVARDGTEGRDATGKAFHELQATGYLFRDRLTHANGQKSWIHEVYEDPSQNPHVKAADAFPGDGQPGFGNPAPGSPSMGSSPLRSPPTDVQARNKVLTDQAPTSLSKDTLSTDRKNPHSAGEKPSGAQLGAKAAWFEALEAGFGQPGPSDEVGIYRRVAGQLAASGADPAELPDVLAEWKQVHDKHLTPSALLKHWGRMTKMSRDRKNRWYPTPTSDYDDETEFDRLRRENGAKQQSADSGSALENPKETEFDLLVRENKAKQQSADSRPDSEDSR